MGVCVLFLCVVVFFFWFEAICVVTNLPSDLGVVKTAETIESLTHPDFLFSGLKNYAG